MPRSTRQAVTQTCPNCGREHDVAVYVSGQRVSCVCGIRFEVKRSDVSTVNDRKAEPSSVDVTTPSRPAALNATTLSVPIAPEVPGYDLLELLGKGGMGEVWRAKQLSLDREVALKLLPEKFANDSEFVRRFEKEATALAALSHPNVVQIIDRGKAGAHYYFVMELVPGANLRELLNGQRPTYKDALRIGAQVARAVDAAHERKIVHRDLKPENVLVDPRGHIKVVDFGLAGMKDSDRNIALTATAVAMGTVNYMAPEQRRDAKNVDHRADLYSMGVLLYELMTGELPMGRFKTPSQLVPGLPTKLDDLICKLLETEPDARIQRAMDVAVALEELSTSSASAPARAPVTSLRQALSESAVSLAQAPAAGWKLGVFALGTLVLVGVALKVWPSGPAVVEAGKFKPAPQWYGDTDDELFSTFDTTGNRVELVFDSQFDGGEEINVHSGQWSLEQGVLKADQYGDSIDLEQHPVLKPRAYLAKRYYSADDLDLSVEMEVAPLSREFPPLPAEAQRFGELAFRIKDLQVSVFAVPDEGMRLNWHYFTSDGKEMVGSSADDVKKLVEDGMHVPKTKFRVRLAMKRKGNEIDVEAFVNQQRFAHKTLPGLAGQVGKIAMGCRNASCKFDDLWVAGKAAARPAPRPGTTTE